MIKEKYLYIVSYRNNYKWIIEILNITPDRANFVAIRTIYEHKDWLGCMSAGYTSSYGIKDGTLNSNYTIVEVNESNNNYSL